MPLLLSTPSPRTLSAILMTLAMSLHFASYELGRSASLTLVTSSHRSTTTGFLSSPSALPLAMACITPFSLLLLYGYSWRLQSSGGARVAVRDTGLLCVLVLSLGSVATTLLASGGTASSSSSSSGGLFVSSLLRFVLFVFQNSYAHLLYSQHWSFIGSVLTSREGTVYFPLIAGMSSLTSTVAGWGVGRWMGSGGSGSGGVGGLMVGSAVGLMGSVVLADGAYGLADKHGFTPTRQNDKKNDEKDKINSNNNNAAAAAAAADDESGGMLRKASRLFRRVPLLHALFCEVLSFQCVSTILNVCMVTKLKHDIVDDRLRAAWTGRFYALINGCAAVIQFVILPLTMKRINPKYVWRLMPMIATLFTSLQCFSRRRQADDGVVGGMMMAVAAAAEPSLYLVSASFFLVKMMDYSVRGVVNELVYTNLDFESRYLGKEIIGVFANRMGKSGTSLILSLLTSSSSSLLIPFFGGAIGLRGLGWGLRELTVLGTLGSFLWMGCAFRVSGLMAILVDGKKDEDGDGGKKGNEKGKMRINEKDKIK